MGSASNSSSQQQSPYGQLSMRADDHYKAMLPHGAERTQSYVALAPEEITTANQYQSYLM